MGGYIGLEAFTLSRILKGNSLARFGDGELSICAGGNARFQDYDDDLAAELRRIAWGDTPCLVGIPHCFGYRPEYWGPFMAAHARFLNMGVPYVSSFISRADEAPPVRLNTIWKGRDVVLVASGDSLVPDKMPGAKSVEWIRCPPTNAWDVAEGLEEKVRGDLAVLCCGATATVLADRLARKGIQAVDLGYSGQFM